MWQGDVPLVVEVESADIIATLISLKFEVERELGTRLKLTIVGAREAHLLASELYTADIGVILSPSRPYPSPWEAHRMYVSLRHHQRRV